MTKSWTELTIGALLLISPWVLGFSDITVAKWCNVLFGLFLMLMGAWTVFGQQAPAKALIKESSRAKSHTVEKNNQK